MTREVQRDVAQAKILKYLSPRYIEEIVMVSGKKGAPEYGVIDHIVVRNALGGLSKIGFKSCDQGREKFQGASLDFVWFDEEPPEDIYNEPKNKFVASFIGNPPMNFFDGKISSDGTRFVANANNRVFVKVSGAGRLVGLDNGDSTDFEQYKGTSRRLFSGKLLAVVAAKLDAGDITLRAATSRGIESTISLRAVAADNISGVSAVEENAPREYDCTAWEKDIPVRKIALYGESKRFTSECSELTFRTEVFPSDSTYKDEIEYRITTVMGITSNLAEIVSVENGNVTVRCKGDGEFWLRALCKNGTDKYHIISAIKLCGDGLGDAFIDPYSIVKGGLRSVESGNIGNGFQRGAKFAGGDSWFGFQNVDFGEAGSDTITLPAFAYGAVNIKVYDGIPDKGGELIGDFVYEQKAVWLTYSPQTFRLNKRLRGVHTICLASSNGFDIEGFVFEKLAKEFAELNAADCDKIYGDSFTVNDTDVTGIGNNVVLDFGKFDFTNEQPAAIAITGRSKLPLNTINIDCKGDTEKRIIINFEGSDEYTERIFTLEKLSGVCSISFTFLPGSNFDLRSFRFVK